MRVRDWQDILDDVTDASADPDGWRAIAGQRLGWPEDTPVETALPTDIHSVSAKRVIETGSPTLNEAAPAAE